MNIRINFDGSCNNMLDKKGLPTPAGVGIAVFIDEVYNEKESYAIPLLPYELGVLNTNNTTEWQGCVFAMSTIKQLKKKYVDAKFTVQSDSQVVAYVFNGKNQTSNAVFKEYMKQAKAFEDKIKIDWIEREYNKEADVLSKKGNELAQEQMKNNSES